MARIMIIDDDRDIVESLSMILEGNGYEVSPKSDTAGIVDSVKEVNPDLIILDIVFPEDAQAGFKVARELRHDEAVKQIPVLILSAVNQLSELGFSFSEKDISDDFMPVGGFLEKPIEPNVLLEKLKFLLG